MPNWCSNYIEISASKEAITRLIKTAKAKSEPDNEEIVEFSFLPFVEHLIGEDYKDNWYELNREVLLGCKWFPELTHVDFEEQRIEVSFETPWGPSYLATRHLAEWLKKHDPEFSLAHYYEEPGMGFCGIIKIDADGESELEGERIEIYVEDYDQSDIKTVASLFHVSEQAIKDIMKNHTEDEWVAFYPQFFEGHQCTDTAYFFPHKIRT